MKVKHVVRKNQIIITTLAIMIAVAGYLNYSGRILEKQAEPANSDDSKVLLTDPVSTAANTYANTYEDTYEDIVSLDGDGSEAAAAQDAGTTAVGEAVLASSTQAGANVLAAAKLNREQVRAKNKETLQELIDSANITEEEKAGAVAAMTQMTQLAEKEAAAELLLEAKGFEGCIVSIADGTVDVVVNQAELDDVQRAQIEDVVKRKTELPGESIVITPGGASLAD